MTQFETITIYLCGALLCFIMGPAVTRAEKIWKDKPIEKNEGLFLKDTTIYIGMSMMWPIMLPCGVILWLYYAINILVWTSLQHKEYIKRQESDKKLFEKLKEDSERLVTDLLKDKESPEK